MARKSHGDKPATRLEKMTSAAKNHRILSVVLFVGVVIGAIASFTKALDTIVEIGSRVTAWWIQTQAPLADVIIGRAELTNIEFSVVNARADRILELTGIDAIQLESVDLCRGCDFHARTKLHLKLSEKSNQGKPLFGEFSLFGTQSTTRIFGDLGVHQLAAGDGASFSLSVETPGQRGSVFYLILTLNDLKERKQHTVIPPYLFYFVGPPDYHLPSLRAFGFNAWLGDKDEYLRVNAARALGNLKDERGQEPLVVTATRDASAAVRAAALSSLARFKSELSYTTILDALVDPTFASSFDTKEGAEIRAAAARALGNYGDQRAIPYLVKVWHHDRGFWVANRAVESIGKIGGTTAFAAIEQIFREFELGTFQEHWSRSSIVEVIGYSQDSRARPILVKELFRRSGAWDDHFNVRAAAEALRNYPSPETTQALLELSKQKNTETWVRVAAIRSLIALRAEKEVQELRSDDDQKIRGALESALREEEVSNARETSGSQ